MPENNSDHPHLSFKKMDIEKPRKKQIAPPKKIERDNISYGKDLEISVKKLQDDYEQTVKKTPPEFDPALIFRIKIDAGTISEDDWRRSGLTLLSEEVGNYVVLFSADQLEVFKGRVGKYGEEIPERQAFPQYSWIASLATDMVLWGRENRIGKKLANITIENEKEYLLDVELWNYGSNEEAIKRKDELKTFVEHSGGRFLDFYLGASLNVSRVKITGSTLNALFDVGIVEMIDLPPQPDLQIGQILNTALDDFTTPIVSPLQDAQGLCIIDSGIASGHPLLGSAIGDLSPIPLSLGSGVDVNGHGTRVAGIALYGDVKDCIAHLDFSPQFFLFGARVTNAENRFDDEKLIVKQMDEAIRSFHTNYGCRIFNISLADPDLIYDGGKPSQWAQILDSLASELDVLIIVCTGNIPLAGLHGDEACQFQGSYPKYLLAPESRILEPATAVNVLTVGALADRDIPATAARFPNDPSIRAMAMENQPSPFTRSGPGVNDSVKPDVCEYGGNLTWNGSINTILNNDPEIGIVSTNHEHLRKLFTSDIGTSYAAPKVTNLAGRIFQQYPGITANLARALIANSSTIPQAVLDILDVNSALQICGYGKPNIEKALFSTDSRVTLFAEDVISVDAMHVYQIPIPEEFKETNGKRAISVSLAFDPPVRYTRKGYLGLKMEYVLLRGLTTDRVVDWYSAREEGVDDLEKIEQKYKCDMCPAVTKRKGGTLQKGVWSFSRNKSISDYEGDVFHLVVLCKTSSWLNTDEVENQKYSVVVTLEHMETQIDIYNIVQQSIRQKQRARI